MYRTSRAAGEVLRAGGHVVVATPAAAAAALDRGALAVDAERTRILVGPSRDTFHPFPSCFCTSTPEDTY